MLKKHLKHPQVQRWMVMGMREELIELLITSPGLTTMLGTMAEFAENADWLIDRGVTIPVRCKDCKYWDEQNKILYTYDSKPENKDNLVDFAECLHWSCWSTCHSTRFNDFCSLGERRTDV